MKYKNLSYSWIVVIPLIFPILLFGQDRLTYKGPLQVGKYKGDANYEYTMSSNDTILNGSFLLQRSDVQALLKKEDISFSIKGNFENNVPNGPWNFQFNEFQSDNNSTVKGNQYVVNVDGKQSIAFGRLNQGKPDGEWSYQARKIKNSEVETTQFQSIINFNNGIPQRNFTIENEQQKLVGRFLRNGVAHDQWTLFTDDEIEATESWNFNEGILKNIIIRSNSITSDITIQKNIPDTENIRIIPLDSTYLYILKMKLPTEALDKVTQSGMFKLLEENDDHYQKINSILQNLRNSSFSIKFNVKIPYYPLNEKDATLLNSVVDHYKKSRRISNILLDNTQLAILKLSDDNVRVLEKSVYDLTKGVLDPLKEVVSYQERDILQYIPREQLFERIWPDGIPITPNGINDTSFSISAINLLSESTFNRLDSIQRTLSKKISISERKQEAIELEKKMIAQRDYLEQLSNTLDADTIPAIYKNTVRNIQKNAENKLANYSDIQDVEKKLSYARELVYCFEKLDNVGETIAQLPKQQQNIRKRYLDKVWNPFTATLMEETTKKRIVQAYEKVLIPHFLKKIEEELQCDETEQWISLVNDTYQKMLVLRDTKDTHKLERKLRKEKNPQLILEQFAIYSSNKTNNK